MSTVRSPRIKICGICSVEDAQLAVRYGAKYIGLIFVKSSPRYIEPVIAKSIADSINGKAQIVGVFQNSSQEEIENIASLVGLDHLQLHGQESPSLCSSLSKPVIKVFELQTEQQPASFLAARESYKPYCQYFLFDKPKTNANANWLDFVIQYLKPLEPDLPEYFLAGGLNAGNIQNVLDELNPAVIDVASGVEETPRIKSETLMSEFCLRILSRNQKVQTSPVKIKRLNTTEHNVRAKATKQDTKSKSYTIANGGS